MKFENQYGDRCEVKGQNLQVDMGICVIFMQIISRDESKVVVKDPRADGSFVETEMEIKKLL